MDFFFRRPNKIHLVQPGHEEDIATSLMGEVSDENNLSIITVNFVNPKDTDEGMLIFEKRLHRPHRSIGDHLSKEFIIKAIPVKYASAAGEVIIEGKLSDTSLAYKPPKEITDYAPEVDIHSENMFLIMDHMAYEVMGHKNVPVEGIKEDFLSIESISAQRWHDSISQETSQLKAQFANINSQIQELRYQFSRWVASLYGDQDDLVYEDDPFKDMSDESLLALIENEETYREFFKQYGSRFEELVMAKKSLEKEIKSRERAVVDDNLVKIGAPQSVSAEPDEEYIFVEGMKSVGVDL